MVTLNIAFDVWKALQENRKTESETENDVLRRMFKMPALPRQEKPWRLRNRGVKFEDATTFSHGTVLRAFYKGLEYHAKVVDGALELEGQRFKTPSAAARKITGGVVNGWLFWEYLNEHSDWHPLDYVRSEVGHNE